MSTPLILACFWVVLGAFTAFLRIRHQMVPGLILLISAPILMVWIGMEHGWFWLIPMLLAFASMMRNPLIYMLRRARGENPPLPQDFDR